MSGRTLIVWALKWFRLCWTCSVVSWRLCCLRLQEVSSAQVQSLRRRQTTAQTTQKKTSGVIQRRTIYVNFTQKKISYTCRKINVCVWFQHYCLSNTRQSYSSGTFWCFCGESYLPKQSSPRWRLLNGPKCCWTSRRKNAVQVRGPRSTDVCFVFLFLFRGDVHFDNLRRFFGKYLSVNA